MIFMMMMRWSLLVPTKHERCKMITLTQDISRLTLHANFERACLLPDASVSITHLCALLRQVDPDFFTNNGAFEAFYGNEFHDYTDFDLMVTALMDIHTETLLEDNTAGFYHALGHYGIPDLPDEANWGDSVDQLLDALLSYFNHDFPSTNGTANCINAVDAEFVECA